MRFWPEGRAGPAPAVTPAEARVEPGPDGRVQDALKERPDSPDVTALVLPLLIHAHPSGIPHLRTRFRLNPTLILSLFPVIAFITGLSLRSVENSLSFRDFGATSLQRKVADIWPPTILPAPALTAASPHRPSSPTFLCCRDLSSVLIIL